MVRNLEDDDPEDYKLVLKKSDYLLRKFMDDRNQQISEQRYLEYLEIESLDIPFGDFGKIESEIVGGLEDFITAKDSGAFP